MAEISKQIRCAGLAIDKELITEYVEKFKQKMQGASESASYSWVDGIGGLSAAEKEAIFKAIKPYTKGK